MKNGFFFFLGLFFLLAVSWAGLGLGTNAQLGGMTPYFDAAQDKAFPEPSTGLAARGRLVYQDLNCAACHTQQVRREGYGSDIERKWGTRQSWARDYIYQDRVQLGSTRIGPDLANVGARLKTVEDAYKLLYHGTDAMPAFPFLFEERPVAAQASPLAVDRTDNREVVPSRRAEALAAYLLSLNADHNYAPEAARNAVKAEEPEAPKAGAPGAPAAAGTAGTAGAAKDSGKEPAKQ